MKEVAAMWRTATEEEKQEWAKKAVLDKQRYDDELSKYDGPLKVSQATATDALQVVPCCTCCSFRSVCACATRD
jgi:HMG (high mobility group) box